MFLSQSLFQTLEHEIKSIAGSTVRITTVEPISGGDINQNFKIQTNVSAFFVKVNAAADAIRMFAAEMTGLKRLQDVVNTCTPTAYRLGQVNGDAFLLMEWIEPGPRTRASSEALGNLLATIHKTPQPYFGLEHDNFIATLTQHNGKNHSWLDFFIIERLERQIRIAHDGGLLSSNLSRRFQTLYNRLETVFPNEPPALLHGDMWKGNYLITPESRPLLIDPAIYFGFREVDLAMTRLFGGFDTHFYRAYSETYPLLPDWEDRVDLLNLYPLLVHLNLFGKSYLTRIEFILHQFNS